jgi:acyl-coenzyme A thioesterase PaaI-like protein
MAESTASNDPGHTKVRAGEHHVASDLGFAVKLVAPDRALLRAPMTDAVRSAAGAARLGVLVTLADVVASDPALAACLPDWTATQALDLHAAAPLTEGPIVVDAQLLRVGKKVVVVEVGVHDGGGIEAFDALVSAIGAEQEVRLAGRGLVVFARLPGTAARGAFVADHDPRRMLGQERQRTPAALLDDAYELMGISVLDAPAGVVRMERTPYVANSIGTINGGAQAVHVEVAAEAAVPGHVATDVQLHYLDQMRVGPAVTRAEVLRATDELAVVDVSILDAGDDDRMLTRTTVTLQCAAAFRTQQGS